MKLSLILVNWNSWEHASEALSSLREDLKSVRHEIFFIDNQSTEDHTASFQKDFSDLNVHFSRNDSNLGFAKAVNQGLEKASGEFIALVNPDTKIGTGSILKSLEYMQAHPKVGFLGSRLRNSDGSVQKWTAGSFPSVTSAFNHYFFLSLLSEKFKGMFLGKDYKEATEVDWLCGAFLMINSKMLHEIGFLDESFFMYAEDMDWCLRAGKKGWKVVYYPEAEVLHHSGKSMAKFKKERYWRGLFSIHSFYARTKSKGLGLFLFDAITAFGYFLRTLLFFVRALFSGQAQYWQKTQQSLGFTQAAFGIWLRINFLSRKR